MNSCITMKSLGENGRFGNQIFQYAFMRYYARQYGLQIQVPHWQGQELFGFEDSSVSVCLPQFKVADKSDLDKACEQKIISGVDFWGYFQDIEYFSEDKDYFCELFTPVDALDSYLKQSWSGIEGSDVIGLHLRYGDYGYSYFFETPLRRVITELEKRWDSYTSPVLYLATDDTRAQRALKQFSPVLLADIFPDARKNGYPEFFADFWALSQVNSLLLIANSSFSFAASLLNRRCLEMLRPSLSQKSFVPFDPWCSAVLLREVTPWLSFLQNNMTFAHYYNIIRRFFFFNLSAKLKLLRW